MAQAALSGPAYATRLATVDDLPQIVALTAARRGRLAAWSPQWWNPSAIADQIHPLWLRHLVQADGPIVRVVEDGAGLVVGCVVSMPQVGQWFVDDIALADDDLWPTAGAALLEEVAERPALSCVPTGDATMRDGVEALGMPNVSSLWIRSTDGATGISLDVLGSWPSEVPDAPPHTFVGAIGPDVAGGLLLGGEHGVVIGSPSLPPPPIYGAGGTVCIVDRVAGSDLRTLLSGALGAAGARGDVMVAVVVGGGNADLAAAVAEHGFVRTVEVVEFGQMVGDLG